MDIPSTIPDLIYRVHWAGHLFLPSESDFCGVGACFGLALSHNQHHLLERISDLKYLARRRGSFSVFAFTFFANGILHAWGLRHCCRALGWDFRPLQPIPPIKAPASGFLDFVDCHLGRFDRLRTDTDCSPSGARFYANTELNPQANKTTLVSPIPLRVD